jgi:hypothetical protein
LEEANVGHCLKESKMKGPGKIWTSLFLFIAFQGFSQAVAQSVLHRVLDRVDLPAELNPLRKTGCLLEFREEWVLDPPSSSISKKVNGFELSCEDSSDLDFPASGELRIKNISYEFSFLDLLNEAASMLQEEAVRKLQSDFIDLIIRRIPVSELYNPKEQLLSIYFHEDWILEADNQEIRKQVKGITPVIWQQRLTAEGIAVPDPETGYPVYYKLKLERIDLRQP